MKTDSEKIKNAQNLIADRISWLTAHNIKFQKVGWSEVTDTQYSSLVGNPETDWYVYAIRTLEGIHKELE